MYETIVWRSRKYAINLVAEGVYLSQDTICKLVNRDNNEVISRKFTVLNANNLLKSNYTEKAEREFFPVWLHPCGLGWLKELWIGFGLSYSSTARMEYLKTVSNQVSKLKKGISFDERIIVKDYMTKKYGVFDMELSLIVPCEYDMLSLFWENYAYFVDGNEHGFLNKDGKEVLRVNKKVYKEIYFPCGGMVACKTDRGRGFLNIYGKLVIPDIYDKVVDFKNGYGYAFKKYYNYNRGEEDYECHAFNIYGDDDCKRGEAFMNMYWGAVENARYQL